MFAVLLALALVLTLATSGDAAMDAPDPIEGDDQANDLSGTGGDDLIHGNGGNDTIQGYGGDDTITGGGGDNHLKGGAGDDLVRGGPGNDWIEDRDSDGDDTLRGGGGDDTFDIHSPEGQTLANGWTGDDTFRWSAGEATLNGGDGDDTFALGGPGSPDQDEGPNSGSIDGGDGRDVVTLPFYSYAPRELLFRADGSAQLSDGTDTIDFANVEEFHLGRGDTLVDATQTTTGVHVEGEHDIFWDGDITLLGGSGNDTLIDGNVIDGGAGDDLLGASRFGSTLTGGEGGDTFAYDYDPYYDDPHGWYHSATAQITDFNPAEDRLSLTISYVEEYSEGPDTIHVDPPEVTIVSDPDNNQTLVMVNGEAAMALQGLSDLDPSLLDITYNPR